VFITEGYRDLGRIVEEVREKAAVDINERRIACSYAEINRKKTILLGSVSLYASGHDFEPVDLR